MNALPADGHAAFGHRSIMGEQHSCSFDRERLERAERGAQRKQPRGSIMPTRPIMLGKDKVVDRANRLIVVSDRG